MRPRIPAMILVLGTLLGFEPAEAGIMCTWFGRCLYESPGFKITVVDKETGKPLVDVHALAEWQAYGPYGRNGPLMVQDAVSQADGVLTFLAWGPLHGSRAGLVINSDPVITLFKPGYKVLLLNNAVPVGLEETDRVRGFSLGVQSCALERFRGTPDEWIEQLRKVWRGLAFPRSNLDTLEFRGAYLNRLQSVWAEREKVPQHHQTRPGFFWFVQEELKDLMEVQQ